VGMQFIWASTMQRVRFTSSQFIYSGEELFKINSKIWEVLEVFFQRCTIFMQGFVWIEMCNLIVLLDFKDINLFHDF